MNLTINSTFRPFTYDELAKPLVQYKEVYDKREQDYSDLVAQTEMWADIANRENSPEAYAMYKKYSDDLNRVVDDFSRGMTLQNQGQFLNLRRRYAKEITPIARASAALEEARKYRQDMRSKDNSVEFVQDYNSLDDFLHGKVANNEYVSGKDVTARVAAKAEKLAQAMYSNPDFKKILDGDQKYQVMMANGYTPEAMMQVIMNDPKASPELMRIYNEELASIGLDRFSQESQARLRSAAETGMYAGLQKPTYQFLDNGEYRSATERDTSARGWAAFRLQQDEYNLKKAEYEKDRQMKNGEIPFATDPDGTKHYSNGASYWTEVPVEKHKQNNNGKYLYKGSDGKTYESSSSNATKAQNGVSLTPMTETTYERQGKTSISKGGIREENQANKAAEEQAKAEAAANKIPNREFPNLSWHADNDSASNINSSRRLDKGKRPDINRYDDIKQVSELSADAQKHIADQLVGTGWNINQVRVGVIRHWHKDDEYYLIPNVDTSQESSDYGNVDINTPIGGADNYEDNAGLGGM